MEKNWKTAPWLVRIIFIYWIIPMVLTVIFMAFLMLITATIGGIWRIPIDLFRVEYDAMPIITSIDLGFSIMYFSAGFYAWRLLRGNGTSRVVLEVFSWISIVFTAINLFYPGLHYFEVENISFSITDWPFSLLALAVFFLGLQSAILYMLRTTKVRNYADVF